MDRDADLIGLLAVDHHRLDALGDHGLGDVAGCGRCVTFTFSPPLMPISSASSAGISTNGSGTSCTFIGIVLGPVVVVLGQPVRRADDVEALLRACRTCPSSVLNFLTTGIVRLLGMERIRDRAFDRLVVLGERPVRECRPAARTDAAHAFGIHDERPHVVLRLGVRP